MRRGRHVAKREGRYGQRRFAGDEGRERRSPWLEKVAAVVSAIPKGQTASYAQVALWAGKPGASRAVVLALQALGEVPWWRVVRSDGTVAKAMFATQAPKLRREGVQLHGRRVEFSNRMELAVRRLGRGRGG
jgi:methylated-DNA-protein-cysteine methyltransferase-like protein